MKQFIIAALVLFTFFAVKAQQLPSSAGGDKNLSYKIISSVNKTWGYDIYNNGKLFIHQPSIPALPGNTGFKVKADAEKVAQLVISKVKKGEMPPTLTTQELTALNVLK
jgi:hypothetical protein